MQKIIPLIPFHYGKADVSDILETIDRFRGPDRYRMSDERFESLSRHIDGTLVGLTQAAVFNSFTQPQMERIAQDDKDTIRYMLSIQMVPKRV